VYTVIFDVVVTHGLCESSVISHCAQRKTMLTGQWNRALYSKHLYAVVVLACHCKLYKACEYNTVQSVANTMCVCLLLTTGARSSSIAGNAL
jgi:hypothetical protein